MQEATLLGLAAIVTAFGGLLSTVLALRHTRTEEQADCLERLKETRAEAEALAIELHRLRMDDEAET